MKLSKAKLRFEEWAKYADEDQTMAEIALKEDGPPNQICFHSQQIAEKYLKGYLVFCGKEFEKNHLLRYLLELCGEEDQKFRDLDDDIIYLTQFYTETRYPGDIPEFNLPECQKALKAAIRVKEFVLSKVKPDATSGGFGLAGFVVVIAAMLVLAGGGGDVKQFIDQRLISKPLPDQPITVTGKVVEIDSDPLFRDGDGVLRLRGDRGERITVLVPAGETLCEAKGALDVFHQVQLDDTVEASGLGNKNVVRVCNSPDHYLKIINKDITSASAPSGVEGTSPELVEGWKTYRNEKYGFEVTVPWGITNVGNPASNSVLGSVSEPVSGLYLGPFVIVVADNDVLRKKVFDYFNNYKHVATDNPEILIGCEIRPIASSYRIEAVKCGGEGGRAFYALIKGIDFDVFVDGYSGGYNRNYEDYGTFSGTTGRQDFIDTVGIERALSTFKFVK